MKKRVAITIPILFVIFLLATPTILAATHVTLYTPSSTDITSTSVKLTWSKTQDLLFQRYEIWSMNISHGGQWQKYTNISNSQTTSYSVTGLSPSTTYSFKIRDVDSLGSEDSNEVTATTKSAAQGVLETPEFQTIVGILVLISIIVIVIVALVVIVRHATSKKPQSIKLIPK